VPNARAFRLAGIAGRSGEKLMKFRPLHDRVVIRRIEGEDKTKGGIIIPDTVKEKPQEGEVIAVGPGARDESGKLVPLELKAGDRVLFGKWSGTEVKIDGEDLLIMKESDVMGVIEGASATKKKRPEAASSSHLKPWIEDHVRQRRTLLLRRARPHAARRRYPQ
jgi:chaperonin GroES